MAKIVAICLILSNILVGTAGYFIVRQLDRDYSELLHSSLPTLNTVRALSWQVARIQRTINRLDEVVGTDREARLQRQLLDIDDADGLLRQVITGASGIAPAGTMEKVRGDHAAYVSAVIGWRTLIAQGQAVQAGDLLLNKVRPAYDTYENVLDELATVIHDRGITDNYRLSAEAGKLGGGLVLMAAWPLWLGGLAILVVGLSVAVLGALLKWKAPDLFQS